MRDEALKGARSRKIHKRRLVGVHDEVYRDARSAADRVNESVQV